jgi:hypothetical protein
MNKFIAADALIIGGLILIGIGIHLIYPPATPYFVLGTGFSMCTLWGVGIVKGRRR